MVPLINRLEKIMSNKHALTIVSNKHALTIKETGKLTYEDLRDLNLAGYILTDEMLDLYPEELNIKSEENSPTLKYNVYYFKKI